MQLEVSELVAKELVPGSPVDIPALKQELYVASIQRVRHVEGELYIVNLTEDEPVDQTQSEVNE